MSTIHREPGLFLREFRARRALATYIARLQEPGQWGGDLEIQAMAELYNRSIEIYAYSAVPNRCYLKHLTTPPIRLSYHFRSHYNSVVDPPSFKQAVVRQVAGVVEDEQIRKASWMGSRRGGGADATQFEGVPVEMQAFQRALAMSRCEFQKVEEADMDRALEASLNEFERRMARELMAAQSQSELEHQEKLILEQVIKQSEGNISIQDDSAAMARALKASIQDVTPQDEYPPAVKECLAMQFPLGLCVEAYSLLQPTQPDTRELVTAMTDYILKERALMQEQWY